MPCKDLRLLSTQGKPLFLSCISCKISGNFKFSCRVTKPKYCHISLVPRAIGHISFYCNVLSSPALLCPWTQGLWKLSLHRDG